MQLRKTWIDGMKGIAICGVVMIHSGGSALPSVLGKIGGLGASGVQVFFLLSSYLTFLSMEKAFSDGMNGKVVKRWMLGKFTRLMPLYYLALVIGCLIGGNPYWLGSEGRITIPNVLAHISFTHGLFPHYCDSIISVEWYLGVLAIFYVLAPLLFRVINNIWKAVTLSIWGTLICTFVTYVAVGFIPEVGDAYVYASYFETFSFIAQLPVLLLGIVLYYVLKEGQGKREEKQTAAMSCALLVLALVMIGGIARNKTTLWGVNGAAMFGVCFFLIALSQHFRASSLIDNPLFRYLGKNSYPIYLLHYYVISAYQQICEWYGLYFIENEVASWLVKFMVVLSLTALIAKPLTWLSNQVLHRFQFGNAELNV